MARLLTLPLAAVLFLALAAGAFARAPADFAGVMLDYGGVLGSPTRLDSEFGVMRTNRVGRVRVPLYWSSVQPYRQMSAVPEDQRDRFTDKDGIPTDLSAFDRIVEGASMRGIEVLPVVLDAPPWAAGDTPGGLVHQPAHPADYGRFLSVLAHRYGADGTFWTDHPGLKRTPVELWQIWNEPNLAAFWKRPWVPGYVALLKASRRALRAADPTAQVVTAGITSLQWEDLRRMYQAGVKGAYDVFALNCFSAKPEDLVHALDRVRGVQNQSRDPRPMMFSEMTWDASRGQTDYHPYPWSTTPAIQATMLTQAFSLLSGVRKKYGLVGIFWYSWLTAYQGRDPFDYSGLRVWRGDDRAPASKPLLAAYRRAVARF